MLVGRENLLKISANDEALGDDGRYGKKLRSSGLGFTFTKYISLLVSAISSVVVSNKCQARVNINPKLHNDNIVINAAYPFHFPLCPLSPYVNSSHC